jgi:hypothetical protein
VVLQIFPQRPVDPDLLSLNVARLAKKQKLTSQIEINVFDDDVPEVCLHLPLEANVEEFKELLNQGYAPARVEEYDDYDQTI